MAATYLMRKVIYHPEYMRYNLGAEHPFSPVRVQMVLELLSAYGIDPEFCQPEIISPEQLYPVHDRAYVDYVESVSKSKSTKPELKYGLGTADNPIVEGMAEGARMMVAGALQAADLLISGQANKVLQMGGGFHHAHPALASGFCLYNDLALAIRRMTAQGWHVAYLDIDVHHGDGVQQIFYDDGQVMTISLHESGEYIFPGGGWLHELGQGMGRSLKLNLPLEPFTEGDSYLDTLNAILEPALSWFRPDALIIQAGADAHFSDPLADLMLTTHDFENIFKKILDLSDQYCQGKALFTLGGGYALSATARIWTLLYLVFNDLEIPEQLPSSWRSRWERTLGHSLPGTLHDSFPAYEPIPRRMEILQLNKDLVRRLLDGVSADWL